MKMGMGLQLKLRFGIDGIQNGILLVFFFLWKRIFLMYDYWLYQGKYAAIIVCWLLGNGCLFSWNSMLTIGDYYAYLFPVICHFLFFFCFFNNCFFRYIHAMGFLEWYWIHFYVCLISYQIFLWQFHAFGHDFYASSSPYESCFFT